MGAVEELVHELWAIRQAYKLPDGPCTVMMRPFRFDPVDEGALRRAAEGAGMKLVLLDLTEQGFGPACISYALGVTAHVFTWAYDPELERVRLGAMYRESARALHELRRAAGPGWHDRYSRVCNGMSELRKFDRFQRRCLA